VARISRAGVVQGLLSLHVDPRYLEVGVSRGVTFHAVQAAAKVAVDPVFRFDVEAAASENPNATYHQLTSDEYFGTVAPTGDRFHVIYLDGLHTFEQTLRDLVNALDRLTPDGTVLIDDVKPSSYSASLPDLADVKALRAALPREQSPAWMGDVFRIVGFIETFFQTLSYRTVADNHGQLIVWRDGRASVPERRVEEVARLPFEQTVLDRETYRLEPFESILAELEAWRHDSTDG